MPKNPPELTAERLREVLSYDPCTGIFTWKVTLSPKAMAGNQAKTRTLSGYTRISIDRKDYRAHRLAWLYVHGRWPKDQIDHINGIRSDNRIANLREATPAENQQNIGMSRRNKSGHQGVYWDARRRRWTAKIKCSGKLISIGRYKDLAEAGKAREAAKARLHTFQPTTRLNNSQERRDENES